MSRTARIERPLFHRGGSASTRDGPTPSSASILLSLSNLARRDLTGSAVLWFLSPPLSLWWPVVFFGQVAGLGQTARVQRTPSFFLSIPVAVCSKWPVGGLPHRGRIEGALFHRAPSASTGTPTHRLAPHTGHSSSFHAISQNIHSYLELTTNDSSIRRFSSLPAVLAHWSTFLRIQRCTSANSGDA